MKERYYWERAQCEQCGSFAKKPDGLMVGLDDLRSLSNLCDADSKPWHSGFVCARCASPGCVQGHLAESGTSVLWKPFINISKILFFFLFFLAIFSSQKKLKWQPSFPAAEMLLCSQFQSLLFTRQYKFSLYNKNNHLYSLAASNNTDSGTSFGALEENMNHLSHRTKRRRPLSTEQSCTTTHRACSPTSAGVVVPRKKHLSCTSSEEYCCHISEV